MNLSAEQIEQVKSWLVEAGQIAMDGFASAKMHWKPDHTPVTDIEYRMESLIIERLREHFPGHQIISEESGKTEDAPSASEAVWALDPIDGTKSYIRGLSTWGISLGLLENGQPNAGFFYQPATQEMFWSSPSGAFWNGQRLVPETALAFNSPLAFLAVPSNTHMLYRISYPRLQAFGSTALHLACVARGIAVGALTRRVYIWDIAGLLPILRQSGAVYGYLSGAPLELSALFSGQRTPEPILAARPSWLAQLREGIERD